MLIKILTKEVSNKFRTMAQGFIYLSELNVHIKYLQTDKVSRCRHKQSIPRPSEKLQTQCSRGLFSSYGKPSMMPISKCRFPYLQKVNGQLHVVPTFHYLQYPQAVHSIRIHEDPILGSAHAAGLTYAPAARPCYAGTCMPSMLE
jgi:hypothetical protein